MASCKHHRSLKTAAWIVIAVALMFEQVQGSRKLKSGLASSDPLNHIADTINATADKAAVADRTAALEQLATQADAAMAARQQSVAEATGSALGKLTEVLFSTPNRVSSNLKAVLSPVVAAMQQVAQKVQGSVEADATGQPTAAVQAAPIKVVGIGRQEVEGVTTTTVPVLTIPAAAASAVTNGVVTIIDPSHPQYQQAATAAGSTGSTPGVTVVNPTAGNSSLATAAGVTVITPSSPAAADGATPVITTSQPPMPAAAAAGPAPPSPFLTPASAVPSVTATTGPKAATAAAATAAGVLLHLAKLHDDKPAAAATQKAPIVVVPPRPASAVVPATTTGSIALHTSTPVTVSSPIDVKTPVTQSNVQIVGEGRNSTSTAFVKKHPWLKALTHPWGH